MENRDRPPACARGDVARIVVIGGGVTGLTAALEAADRGAQVTLLEADRRLGGKIDTERVAGFVIEAGADTLVTTKPDAHALIRSLGLTGRLTPPRPVAGSILRNGIHVPVPDGLAVMVPQRLRPIMTSRLLSLKGRARAAMEIVVPRRRVAGDESVQSFVTRRLGREVFERLAEPLIGGMHPGDVSALGIQATFPHLPADEKAHGSLARAILRRRLDGTLDRRRRRAAGGPGQRSGTSGAHRPAGAPLPPLAAPATGMAEVVERLAAIARAVGVEVRVGRPALALCAAGSGGKPAARGRYVVHLHGGQLTADGVVLAVPAAAAGRLCRTLDPELAADLERMPVGDTVAVSLGFRAEDLPPGAEPRPCAVPRSEGRAMRACTVVSHRYPDRAPDGGLLVRVTLREAPSNDQEAVDVVRAELAEVMGVTARPTLTRVHRWENVMPRYTVGHRERVAALRRRLDGWPGLVLAGSPYDGAAVGDCITSGKAAAARLVDVGAP